MAELVRITDVSPRDGLQNEPGVIPTEEKVELVRLLCETGVDEVEVSSFVSPKWVPQLGDAEAVFLGLLRSPSLREGLGVGSPSPAGSQASARAVLPARNRRTMGQARSLRRAMTGPEQALWEYLRHTHWMGAKFRRQHPFGPYILDFFCLEKLLCVEVDGRSHADELAQRHDKDRDEYLQNLGIHVVRVSNDRVLNDAKAVAESIRREVQQMPSRGAREPTPQPPPSGRGSLSALSLSALVPNERGMQGVLDVNKKAGRRLIDKVAVFTAASETFSQRNTNASIEETLQRFIPVVHTARAEALSVRGYISCAIACPFEGPVQPSAVADVARRLADIGVQEIDYGDTIGAATPDSIRVLLSTCDREVPIVGGRLLSTLHLHDTFNRAADCVKAALDAGVRSFDGSVAGLGGCPYASTPGKRAPGNISTELLVRTIENAGYQTNVNLDKLSIAADYARKIVAASRAGGSGGGAA